MVFPTKDLKPQTKLRSLDDVDEQFVAELRAFFEMDPPRLPINQMIGFDRFLYYSSATFPANPTDGQMFGYKVDANTIWQLRYSASIGDSYKWIYAGGGALGDTAGSSTTTSATYADLADGAHPTVTVPLAGIYRVDFGVMFSNSTIATARCAPSYGGSSPQDSDSIGAGTGASVITSGARAIQATLSSAGQAAKLQYKVSTGTLTCDNRWILVTPYRVTG